MIIDAKKIPVPEQYKPYSQCYVCGQDNPGGLHFINKVDGERGILEFRPKSFMAGLITDDNKLMHGGFTMMMFDEIMLYSIKNICNIDAVSLNINVNFTGPANMDYLFRVETVVREIKDRKVYMDAVMTGDGKKIADAAGLYYIIDMEKFVNTGSSEL